MKSPCNSKSSFSCWCGEQISGFKPKKGEEANFGRSGNSISLVSSLLECPINTTIGSRRLLRPFSLISNTIFWAVLGETVSLVRFFRFAPGRVVLTLPSPAFKLCDFSDKTSLSGNAGNHGAGCLIPICKVQIEHDVIHDLKVKNINVDCFKSTRNIYLWHFRP